MLRLLSMWFVVCVHYVGWGGIASVSDVPMINFAVSGGIAVACNCAVNCFFLISGFFISENENTQRAKKRILKVWIPTLTYSILIPVLLCAFGIIRLNSKQIVLLIFPIIGNKYWFSTVFIAITALLPFIVKALEAADNKSLIWLLVVLFFLNLKIKTTWFSKLAPYVFGVYLLNDNQYARDFLWRKILKTELFYTSPWMPVHLIGTTLGFLSSHWELNL